MQFDMVEGYIYKIICLVNNKIYIGQTTCNFEERFKNHLRDARRGSGYYLHAAIRKYGEDNFRVTLIDTCKAPTKQALKPLLDALEIKYIKKFDSFNSGFNLTLGGEGGLGRVISEEVKEKIAKAQRGKKLSEEHIHAIKEAMKNLPEESRKRIRDANLGRKASKETIEKLRKSHLGYQPSQETIEKLKEVKKNTRPLAKTLEAARKANLGRQMPDHVKEALLKANLGRKLSEEHKRKIGDAHRGEKGSNYGKHLSEETREKIRQAHLGKRGYRHSEETKEKIRKAHLLRLQNN